MWSLNLDINGNVELWCVCELYKMVIERYPYINNKLIRICDQNGIW